MFWKVAPSGFGRKGFSDYVASDGRISDDNV
jgi:hypothetical protein